MAAGEEEEATEGQGHLPSPQEGASNLQPVLHHAGVVSIQNWWTGAHLCGDDAKV
jgi:hypothetical protein